MSPDSGVTLHSLQKNFPKFGNKKCLFHFAEIKFCGVAASRQESTSSDFWFRILSMTLKNSFQVTELLF